MRYSVYYTYNYSSYFERSLWKFERGYFHSKEYILCLLIVFAEDKEERRPALKKQDSKGEGTIMKLAKVDMCYCYIVMIVKWSEIFYRLPLFCTQW